MSQISKNEGITQGMNVSRCKQVFSMSPIADPVRAPSSTAVAQDVAFSRFGHDEGVDEVKSIEICDLVDDKVGWGSRIGICMATNEK
jgi:hypothetical protein